MEIDTILDLNNKVHEICGWKDGGSLNLSYNDTEKGDLWIYVGIHYNVLTGELIEDIRKLNKQLKEACGDLAKQINIFDEGKDSPSGYFVAIELDKEGDK